MVVAMQILYHTPGENFINCSPALSHFNKVNFENAEYEQGSTNRTGELLPWCSIDENLSIIFSHDS